MKTERTLWKRQPPAVRILLYRRVEYLAQHGMHGATIAESCGISKGDVYKDCKQMQVRLRDYRDGKGPVGAQVVRRAPKGRAT